MTSSSWPAHLRETLRLRQSSPLFRLTTMAEINSQVSFYNGSNAQDALIVMGLADSGVVDLDPNYGKRSWFSSTPTKSPRPSPSAARPASPCTRSTPMAWMMIGDYGCGQFQRRNQHFHHSRPDDGRFRLHQPYHRSQHPGLGGPYVAARWGGDGGDGRRWRVRISMSTSRYTKPVSHPVGGRARALIVSCIGANTVRPGATCP